MSSANWIPRPKLFNEDEIAESSSVSIAHNVVNITSRDKDAKDKNNNTSTGNETNGRSAALERAYVHDVYENCEEPFGSIRPKVAQFLSNLDPHSLVCDVGCGNGRYLAAACNPAIYSVGIDRCFRLSKAARSTGSEVAICDNLELPFCDESFDAVLSLAVVHHFATTERRVKAIRELSRILRIGGRVIITVWALEQKSRRFESQDVLIPWQSPKTKTTGISDDEEDEDDFLPPYHSYTYNEDSTHSNSSRSQGDGDSSSLSSSSPSDTCYSFVRRALQKLASGKKNPWFLGDSWNSKDTKNDSSLDYEDAKDLPIELRRLEDFEDIPEPLSSAGLKSRSLGSILNPPPKQIVRSRSSVPSLGAEMKQSQIVEPLNHAPVSSLLLASSTHSVPSATLSRRPKLIKQKQSISDDPEFPFDDDTSTYNHLVHNDLRAQLLRKQSSLNEELMAESRIREKERIRKRIQKQMSLNESFLCRSVFTKRLQVIREGFTTKLKSSTGSLERVTKSGLVKIMQNIKSASNTSQTSQQATDNSTNRISVNKCPKTAPLSRKVSNGSFQERSSSVCSSVNTDENEKMRRLSRESGSDSSKDSSLQSDTSIESEDSFASVIYIPKNPDIQSNKMPSVPTSPLIMPCPTPIHSPALISSQRRMSPKETTRFNFESPQEEKSEMPKKETNPELNTSKAEMTSTTLQMKGNKTFTKISTIISPASPLPFNVSNRNSQNSSLLTDPLMSKITRQTIKDLPKIPKFKKMSSFPLVCEVRQISSSSANVAVPKLMSLELFNPETDDLDSDSSEPSSPDSIDSVINALQHVSNPTTDSLFNNEKTDTCNEETKAHEVISKSSNSSVLNNDSNIDDSKIEQTDDLITQGITTSYTNSFDDNDSIRRKEIIINHNDINLNTDSMNQQHHFTNTSLNNNYNLKTIGFYDTPDNLEECRSHLIDFAEKLSAQLLRNLDETKERMKSIELKSIPSDESESLIVAENQSMEYINGEFCDPNELRDELRERRLMLANLSTKKQTSQVEECCLEGSNKSPASVEELEEDDSPPLSAKIQSHLSQNPNLMTSLGTPQATKKQQQKINDFIPEENEENDEDESSKADEDSSLRSRISFSHLSYNATNSHFNNTHDTALLLREDSFDEADNSSSVGLQQMKQNLLKNIKHPNKLSDSNNNSNTNSCDSWANSNSTTASLDSPSVGGGSATHHRYYHVFREGELDSLINKHVGNLHIVSSYYERASWCVVCEKVQVWTI